MARWAAHMLISPKKLPGSVNEDLTINSISAFCETFCSLGNVIGAKTDLSSIGQLI